MPPHRFCHPAAVGAGMIALGSALQVLAGWVLLLEVVSGHHFRHESNALRAAFAAPLLSRLSSPLFGS